MQLLEVKPNALADLREKVIPYPEAKGLGLLLSVIAEEDSLCTSRAHMQCCYPEVLLFTHTRSAWQARAAVKVRE